MEQLCDDWVTKNKKTGLKGLFSKGLNPFVYLGPENAFMVLLKKNGGLAFGTRPNIIGECLPKHYQGIFTIVW